MNTYVFGYICILVLYIVLSTARNMKTNRFKRLKYDTLLVYLIEFIFVSYFYWISAGFIYLINKIFSFFLIHG